MDKWQVRVEGHAAVVNGKKVLDVLEGVGLPEDADQLADVNRIRRACEWILQVVENCDPYLASDAALNGIASQLQAIVDNLNAYSSTRDTANLTAAVAQLDPALQSVSYLPISSSVTEAAQEVTSLRRSIGQHRGQIERELDETRSAAEAARQAFAERADEAEIAIRDVRSDVEAALAEARTSVATLQTELDAMTAVVREAANSQQNAFTEAQATRATSFEDLLTKAQADTTAATDALKAEIRAAIASTEERLDNDLATVGAAKKRVEDILDIVGEEALVGTYSKNAAADRRSAFRWSLAAVVFLLATIVAAGFLVHGATKSGTDWDAFFAKSIFVLAGAGLAGYCGRQSHEHRRAQRSAEHMALQLAALKPYLNDLAEDGERDALLSEIAKRMFGQPLTEHGQDGKAQNPAWLAQFTATVIEAMKK